LSYPDRLNDDRFIFIGHSRRQRRHYVLDGEVMGTPFASSALERATRHEKTRYESA
jgi:hypothetical protein